MTNYGITSYTPAGVAYWRSDFLKLWHQSSDSTRLCARPLCRCSQAAFRLIAGRNNEFKRALDAHTRIAFIILLPCVGKPPEARLVVDSLKAQKTGRTRQKVLAELGTRGGIEAPRSRR